MAIVIYNDNGTIKVVKYGNRVVSTDADPIGEGYEFYKVTANSQAYIQTSVKLNVTAPEFATAKEIMYAFKTQHTQYYGDIDMAYVSGLGIRANEDGVGDTYWVLRLVGGQRQWGYVGSFSDQPTAGTYDLLVSSDIGDNYENGLYYLYDNYPLFELYESNNFEYGQASAKVDVIVSEGDAYNESVIMSAFRTQNTQYYHENIIGGFGYDHIAIMADDGIENSYWKLRTTGGYPVGFVVIIDDLSTLSYFKYVVDAI